jgi:hypothetical protein
MQYNIYAALIWHYKKCRIQMMTGCEADRIMICNIIRIEDAGYGSPFKSPVSTTSLELDRGTQAIHQ